MSKQRYEVKVGLFILIGLVLVGLLLLQFSKGTSLFKPTYRLYLRARDVGGLKERATVLMSGVQVGTVQTIRLNPAGTNVTITVRIYRQYVIHKDARFTIQMSGFLGDQFLAIQPTRNEAPIFRDGEEADAQEPFNLQEVARSASGFIQRVDETARKLNDAIVDVRRLVLNEETLTNLSATISTMRSASESALSAVDEINALFDTNGPAISRSASNLVVFTEELNRFSGTLNQVLATNTDRIDNAVKNVEASTVTMKSIMDDVSAGKGTAGTLLRDEQVASNVKRIAENLSITTSNLNRLGLWGILWSKKPKKEEPPTTTTVESPKGKPD